MELHVYVFLSSCSGSNTTFCTFIPLKNIIPFCRKTEWHKFIRHETSTRCQQACLTSNSFILLLLLFNCYDVLQMALTFDFLANESHKSCLLSIVFLSQYQLLTLFLLSKSSPSSQEGSSFIEVPLLQASLSMSFSCLFELSIFKLACSAYSEKRPHKPSCAP